MKKILISLFIISTSLNFSFAEESFINSIIETKTNAIKEIKSLFTENKVELKLENKINEKTLISDTEIKETETSLEKKEIFSEKNQNEKEIKSVLLCENKIKIKDKKDKINLNIKNQIKDKNKLTDKLLEIASTVSTSSKEIIEEKIIKLDTEVGNAIKIQKSILIAIASSTENICDSSKEYVALNKNIKKLDSENEKQLGKINNLIKKDIKNILVEINSKEVN